MKVLAFKFNTYKFVLLKNLMVANVKKACTFFKLFLFFTVRISVFHKLLNIRSKSKTVFNLCNLTFKPCRF